MNEHTDISRQLARFVAETGFSALPQHAVQMTGKCLLDAIGVSFAATTLGEGCKAFSELALAQGGTQESTLFGTRSKVPALMAAFANGALAHALDFEDAHDRALMHPNAANIPVALAIAEADPGISGQDLVTALAVGCEITCRLALALDVSLDEYGWYPPPILGAFGAAATACSLYRLDTDAVLDAFSLVLCQSVCSAEIKYSPHSQIRAVRDAFAAKAGLLSAQLARSGVKGFVQPLEGKAGFYSAFARGNYSPEKLLAGLGESFEISNISLKPWPSCRGTHVYIEAALVLREQHRLTPENISSMHVVVDKLNEMLLSPGPQKKAPATPIDAKFSIPFTVATALCHGNVGLQHFSADALADARILALADRLTYTVREDCGDRGELKIRGELSITTSDGSQLSHALDLPYGNPDKPLSDAFLEGKFRHCMGFSSLPFNADAICAMQETILKVHNLSSISHELLPLLKGATPD